MKKKTIFRLFIIPLVLVMAIQAVISYGTFFFSGTPYQLNDNSVGILRQTVENRKLILENNMVQNWSDLGLLQTEAGSQLERILQREKTEVSQFLQSDVLKAEYLERMIRPSLQQMRKNSVTGTFLILTDIDDAQDGVGCSGIYFRNSGPGAANVENSDILMERGTSRFSHKMNISLGSLWTTDFYFAKEGELQKDEYFYSPYRAALENPEASYENLGFWSSPFTLNDGEKDSYEMITYTIPLIYGNKVYGILGVELSVQYLKKILPAREMNNEGEGGYMLAQLFGDGSLTPLVSTLPVAVTWNGNGIALEDTGYDFLKKFYTDTEKKQALYTNVSRLRLYNTNTPFSDRIWVVAGIQSGEKLFGMGDKIVVNLFLAVCIGLIFGVFCISVIVSHLTRPIRSLSECIDGSSGAHLQDYPGSGIIEIDGLYDVVNNLTLKQQKTENSLIEEKERYRIALESSTDTLFSCDLNAETVDIYNMKAIDGNRDIPELHLRQEECGEMLIPLVHEDDRSILTEKFRDAQDGIYVIFEAGVKSTPEDYRWLELSGRVLYGTDGKRSKIIGSIRNIHEQKMKELATLDTVRRDAVMGIYKRSTGESLIISELEAGRTGCVVLLDIDKFLDLDEKYGMVFGDAVLEQIGTILRHMVKEGKENGRKIIAVRMGGDEMLLWLEECGRQEAEQILEHFRKQVAALYDGASFQLQISGGLTERAKGEGYQSLLNKAQQALNCSKLADNGGDTVYEEMRKGQGQDSGIIGRKEINDIVGAVYDRNIGMIPLVFSFFDKSSDLRGIMPVLLAKLGNRYGLLDILITGAETEFHTVHLSWQWHRQPERKTQSSVHYFSGEEFEILMEKMEDRMILYDEEKASDLEREIFLLPKGTAGFIAPLHDNGLYAGSITYAAGRGGIPDAEKGELQEISKIMESNINREKYDLASRAKSDFLSRMSHEIRTPMNAIMGMTTIALNELDRADKVEECLNKIDSSSQYLLRLINDILDMSKIESGKMKLETAGFSLHELIDGIGGLILPQIESKKIRYETDVLIMREWVSGDFLHLKQVLVNLLSNAVKFTPEGGCITLTVHQEKTGENETEVFFSVRDTGIGVSRQNRKRIFQSFEQADTDTARVYGGTGLGLAISEKLVYMMGGHITLQSEEGSGSDFSFRLLLQPGEKPKEEGALTGRRRQNASNRRILLVEDNELNMEIAQTILEMHHYLVETAENGQEAIDRFNSQPPLYYDLILMDIRMPVMDGLTAARKIRSLGREDARQIPIVAMSANAFAEDIRKSLESGMNGHLSKPINVEELMGTLDKMLGEEK